MPTIVDVKVGYTILHVKNVLSNGILLREDKNGHEFREHSKHCAPCHLSIDGYVHHGLVVVPYGFLCFVCGEKKRAATMLLWDLCQYSWHMVCLIPPLLTLHLEDWICTH